MKTLFLSLLLLALAGFASAQGFEGVIEMTTRNNANGESANLKWTVSGLNHRFDIDGSAPDVANYQYSLFVTNGVATLVSTVEGKTTKYPVSNIPPSPSSALLDAELVRSETSKNIAGFTCKKITITHAAGKYTAWVTGDFSLSADQFPIMLRKEGILNHLIALGLNEFPLELTSYNNAGQLNFHQAVTAIKGQTVDKDVFVIPSEAKTFEESVTKSGN